MSFWDSLKPSKRPPHATAVNLSADQKIVSLTWNDGSATKVGARTLRQHCPCAECVEEWSGKRTFELDTIPEDMKVIEVQALGNYALSFTFGDLHRTGIFQWEYLKELSEKLPA